MSSVTKQAIQCYHCGDDCVTEDIKFDNKNFCCQGCKTVYQVLNQGDMCEYYNLNENPGLSQRIEVRKDKFSFLEDEKIQQQLITFKNDEQTHITFYLPQIHCSSCLWLLENLNKLNKDIVTSRVNFSSKEVDVIFNHQSTSVRAVAELLTSIGYEPYISLQNLSKAKPRIERSMIYQLGVAGFCFGNIMLMSFPEYFGLEGSEKSMQSMFRYLNLILAIPVFLYSSIPFYKSAWGSLKHRYLNIDTPIALAIIITFSRSVYELLSNTGSGYFDSLSGAVFFMLVGRVLQDKTYQQLSFERDYTSYFPIAITVLKDGKEIPTALPDIKNGDTILIHNEELIPADGLLTRGKALIDYSFVTGESLPVLKDMGELVYAGGKQTGGNIEMLVMKEVAQSYLTKLWNNEEKPAPEKRSFVDIINQYFTWVVFTLALMGASYWVYHHDVTKAWNVVTTVLIVACPCALLLSNTFTNGNVLRILGRNKMYLRNAQTIEEIANANHIVFDKTGTLTTTESQDIVFVGNKLLADDETDIASIAACSSHPLSKLLVKHFGLRERREVKNFKEMVGKGIQGIVGNRIIAIGSSEFVTGENLQVQEGSTLFVMIDGVAMGYYSIRNQYRPSLLAQIKKLQRHYKISILSGDNEAEKKTLHHAISKARLLFNQKPQDKLKYIQDQQFAGDKVIMIGDGLNDAGALKQSDAGIAVTESTNNFTPASDGILEAGELHRLSSYLIMAKANKNIVIASFVLSLLYNVVGLYFALRGELSPMIAAILMPSSSVSIILLTFGASTLYAKMLKLK